MQEILKKSAKYRSAIEQYGVDEVKYKIGGPYVTIPDTTPEIIPLFRHYGRDIVQKREPIRHLPEPSEMPTERAPMPIERAPGIAKVMPSDLVYYVVDVYTSQPVTEQEVLDLSIKYAELIKKWGVQNVKYVVYGPHGIQTEVRIVPHKFPGYVYADKESIVVDRVVPAEFYVIHFYIIKKVAPVVTPEEILAKSTKYASAVAKYGKDKVKPFIAGPFDVIPPSAPDKDRFPSHSFYGRDTVSFRKVLPTTPSPPLGVLSATSQQPVPRTYVVDVYVKETDVKKAAKGNLLVVGLLGALVLGAALYYQWKGPKKR